MTDPDPPMPCPIPARIYELTHQMLRHAVSAELADLVVINLSENADTCQLIVDQCVALAECILIGQSSSPWPPTEEELRLVAAATTSSLDCSGEQIARTGPPAATRDAVFVYLSRVVVAGEAAGQVFPPGESVILPVWTTAAMLVSFSPGRSWQDHLELLWEVEAEDGVNLCALMAIESRARRRQARGGTA